MDLDAVLPQQVDQPGGGQGTPGPAGDEVSGRSLRPRLGHGPFALQVEVLQEPGPVIRHVLEGEEKGALLEVDVVAEGPLDRLERRVGPVPGPLGFGAHASDHGVRAGAAERLVEPAGRVVEMGDGESVARAPAVEEAVGPDPRNPAPGHLADLQEGELLPFVDRDRVEPGVEGTRARGCIEIGDGFVEVVHDDRVPFEIRPDQVFGELEAQPDGIPVVVVADIFSPVDEGNGLLVFIFFFVEVNIDGLIPAVHLEDGRHQDDHVLADGLDRTRSLRRPGDRRAPSSSRASRIPGNEGRR